MCSEQLLKVCLEKGRLAEVRTAYDVSLFDLFAKSFLVLPAGYVRVRTAEIVGNSATRRRSLDFEVLKIRRKNKGDILPSPAEQSRVGEPGDLGWFLFRGTRGRGLRRPWRHAATVPTSRSVDQDADSPTSTSDLRNFSERK